MMTSSRALKDLIFFQSSEMKKKHSPSVNNTFCDREVSGLRHHSRRFAFRECRTNDEHISIKRDETCPSVALYDRVDTTKQIRRQNLDYGILSEQKPIARQSKQDKTMLRQSFTSLAPASFPEFGSGKTRHSSCRSKPGNQSWDRILLTFKKECIQ
jgi:hypothetical protein